MMSLQTDNLKNLLISLGINEDEISVYLCLLEKSPQSALEISKALNMGRTKVYRIIENLNKKSLVNILLDEYGSKFLANSPKQIEILIKEKELELDRVKSQSNELLEQLESIKPQLHGETKILYYKGEEGLKQVTWNTTKTKGLFRIYEVHEMDAFLERDFSEKVLHEFATKDIKVHQLTNHKYLGPFTTNKKHVNDWTVKYIDKEDLLIKIEVCIYNDITLIYSYEKTDIFCVEIHNQKFADQQKQIFDLIFKNAKPMTILNDRGEAKLEE